MLRRSCCRLNEHTKGHVAIIALQGQTEGPVAIIVDVLKFMLLL